MMNRDSSERSAGSHPECREVCLRASLTGAALGALVGLVLGLLIGASTAELPQAAANSVATH
jgi:hypothetical protein